MRIGGGFALGSAPRRAVLLLAALLALGAVPTRAGAPAGPPAGPAPVALPKPGKKIPIDAERFFVFSFDKKPAMETIIVKVEVWRVDGGKDTSLEVLGDADMPSMRGAHSLGARPFVKNRKGDYLLPITFVMPGDWEVVFTFRKAGAVIFRGAYAFDI